MDVDGLERLLARLHSGEIGVVARDLAEPSPLALEVLSARPYAYLDDAPLEERRTQAVMGRRWLAPEDAAELGRLDPEAIARVKGEAWPDAVNPDELHDALVWLGFLSADEVAAGEGWRDWLAQLSADRRATRLNLGVPAKAGTHSSAAPALASMGPGFRRDADLRRQIELWVSAERLPQFLALYPNATLDPPIAAPAGYAEKNWSPDEALIEILRGRLEGQGPVTEAALAAPLGLTPADIAARRLADRGSRCAAASPRRPPGVDQDQ
jgi:ATP-dependent Lhr-like helicase